MTRRSYDTFDEESTSRIDVEVDTGDSRDDNHTAMDWLELVGGMIGASGVLIFLYFTIGVEIPNIWRYIQENQYS